jgi:hypothetical protein
MMTSETITAAPAGTWKPGRQVEENLRQLGRDYNTWGVSPGDGDCVVGAIQAARRKVTLPVATPSRASRRMCPPVIQDHKTRKITGRGLF